MKLRAPFEIYHENTHIGNADGHVCSAENPEIADQLLEILNGSEPRPIWEYHEDMGPVLWWWWIKPEHYPEDGHYIPGHWAGEPPYVGTPNDMGFTVEFEVDMRMLTDADPQGKESTYTISRMVGGWPGYHTHFTLIPMPKVPDATPEAAA